jgi:transcriptional regulator with XRE-family HTH domain
VERSNRAALRGGAGNPTGKPHPPLPSRRSRPARTARRLSHEAASAEAKISPGYLHKLEADGVNSPSPRVLQRLAATLDLPYARLMELAGHLMPRTTEDLLPAATIPAPTNAELLRLLEAVLAELAEIKSGQRQLAERLERIASA